MAKKASRKKTAKKKSVETLTHDEAKRSNIPTAELETVMEDNSPTEKQKTGSLYSVVTVNDSGVDDTKWTTLHLSVREKRIVVKLNGEQVVDYTEPDDVQRPPRRSGRRMDPNGGAIAFQSHDPGSV
jgi:hypothetical protein